MGKNKQLLPIRRHLFYVTAFLLGVIILNSCTKINTDKLLTDIPTNKTDITEKFFYASKETDVIIKRVLENLKERNNKYEFVQNFVMENGYPIWDKAIISTKARSYNSITNSVNGQIDTIIQIPLVLSNISKVNGFIAAVINDSINYNLFIGKDYYKYSFNNVPEDSLNADKAAMQIMLLDKAVFGYSNFEINDNRLFSNQNNYNISAPQRIISISNDNGNTGNIIPVCESVIIDWVVIDCGYYGCTGNWYQQLIICASYGGGTSGGGTSGGGSPFPPPPGGTGIPCSGCGTGPSGSPNGTGSGGVGWNPILTPYVFVDNPCAYILQLQNDANFRNKVLALNNLSSYSAGFEKGYTVNNRVESSYTYVHGEPGDITITWSLPFGSKVDGFMHCHNGGLLNNVFSPQDVIYMARAFLQGYARDTANMFFIVTNQSDNPYLIKINNIAKFRTFAKSIAGDDGNDETKMKRFIKNYEMSFISADRDKNTVAFLNMLQKEVGKGLELFRANDDVTKWSKLRLTTNNTDFSGDYCPEP